jgi:ribosomal protein S18 acetylase RimI-like enzyme
MAAAVRAAEPSDLEPVYTLLAARDRALHGTADLTLDDLRHRWALPRFEAWIAENGDGLAGYASLDDAGELEHAAPDAAAGNALLTHAVAQARERGVAALSLTGAPQDPALEALVRTNGFEHDRTILRMWRTLGGALDEPVWPPELRLRSYEPGDAGPLKALLDETYRGWDREYVARPLDGWIAFMTNHDDFDPGLWFLVERDDRLVACALHWRVRRGDGWVKDLVVEPTARGQGLATALLQNGFHAYAERGAARVGLKVDASNPTGAPALYERLGFEIDRRYELWLKRL